MSQAGSRSVAAVFLALFGLAAPGYAFTVGDASLDSTHHAEALADSAADVATHIPQALPELVATLFSAIEGLSYYRTPDIFPMVQRVPHAQIERDFCDGACPVIKAIYEPEKGVYLDNRLNLERNLIDRSILLHELVHHVQAVTGRHSHLPPCERRKAEESEAFAIQNAYLMKMGKTMRFTFPARMYRCDHEVIDTPRRPASRSYGG